MQSKKLIPTFSCETNGIILKVRALSLLGVFTVFTTGWIVGVGNRGNSHSSESHTLGQELMDLKSAYESGAIDPDEYELQRRKLLVDEKQSD